MKEKIKTPLTRFFKNLVFNPKNAKSYYRKYLVENSYGKKEKISYNPDTINVNVTMSCNLRCPTCYYLLQDKNALEETRFIKVEDFQKFIDGYPGKIRRIAFAGGEPLLHPHLSLLFEIAKKNGVQKVSMSTNGVLLKNRLEQVKNFDKIKVSLDAYDFETFKKYRGGTPQQWESILESLKLMRENNIPFAVSFLLSEENLHEVPKMLKFAEEAKVFEVRFHNINSFDSGKFTSLFRESEKVKKFLEEVFSRSDYPFDIYIPLIFDVNSQDFKNSKCPYLWNALAFNQQGDMAYCCYLPHDAEIGNVFKKFDFNSKKMQEMRKCHIKSEFPDECRFCQRRFSKIYSTVFNSKERKWQKF
ncbi:MAG: radical SAM protein [Candidatus Nealsonbacteria bacterium]